MIKPTQENTAHNLNELYNTIKELSIKNKNLSIEEKEVSKERMTDQVLKVLINAYEAINTLNERKLQYPTLTKFKNNRDSLQSIINEYDRLITQAKENNDNDLEWRYSMIRAQYQGFYKNPTQALQLLRLITSNNLMVESKVFSDEYLALLKKIDLKTFTSLERNYNHKEIFSHLYAEFEGYQITHNMIIKSAGLKIFNFFNLITKVQKKSLVDKIEHIFASLGADISLDEKRADKIKVIASYNNIILLDYESNKKALLHDFHLYEIIEKLLIKIVKQLKKSGNLELIKRINKNRKALDKLFIQQLLS